MEKFVQLIKKGLTFETTRGNQTPQTLYRMPLTGNNDFNLDTTSKLLLAKMKESQEDSLVNTSSVNEDDELRLSVLKFIIEDKQNEIAIKEKELTDKTHNQQILALIESKKQQEMQNLSVEDLEKLLRK